MSAVGMASCALTPVGTPATSVSGATDALGVNGTDGQPVGVKLDVRVRTTPRYDVSVARDVAAVQRVGLNVTYGPFCLEPLRGLTITVMSAIVMLTVEPI